VLLPILVNLRRLMSDKLPLTIMYQVRVPWDIARYSQRLPKVQRGNGMQATIEGQWERYPPFHPKVHLSDPAIVVDMHGRIIAWYLPDVLTRERQVRPS
jgi:hypothetical protein